MKHLFFGVFATLLCFPATGISQTHKNDSIEAVKQELLIRIYGNRNERKVINYDKSFVSDSKLYYESLNAPKTSTYTYTDKDLIEKTLQGYIEGSSYNKLDMLESAFAKNATLYLTIKKEFKVLTPKEYLTFFKGTPGTFNGRRGKILDIDITGDIATAIAEILIPERKMRFIDLFLLKKIGDDWKIISKTATQTLVKQAN
ncbi:nuclear transport factor 2 family protein [Galbibacter sp. EGI 63066]|uniref:nuclear transport factor 2 family protein n=1 Tax=Galbibacter sp. EGI 63066 TaxID=2993559 RepID=UPI0022490167|nr:nuclear transport factor 2 family protein [Galbibacter sp. EGI 63066]MCX2679737.1 nuclear transport factor 2 family protein [Galbibacter sp. EGI 63066]